MLGDGSFSICRRCKQKATGQEYAVKIVSRRVDCTQEINLLRACQGHPNIVRLQDVFYDEVHSFTTRFIYSFHSHYFFFLERVMFYWFILNAFHFLNPRTCERGVGEREGGGILCETDAMKWRLFWFVRYRHTLTSSWNCWRVVSCCSVSGSSNTSPKRKPPAFGRNCSPVSVTFIRKESFIAISNPRYIIIHHALPLIGHHNHLWNLLKPRLLPVLLFNVLCK